MENKDKDLIDLLKSMGIYELRELARQVGVESPTTKKRAELCEQIIKINAGELSPNKINLSKGRPPKSVSRVTNVPANTFPVELLELRKKNPLQDIYFSQIVSFAQSNFYNLNPEEDNKAEGILNKLKENYYILQKVFYPKIATRIVYVPDNFVNDYSLREGDFIVGTSNPSTSQANCATLVSLEKVNFHDAADFLNGRDVVDTELATTSTGKIKFLNREMSKGCRALVAFDSPLHIVEDVVDFIDKDTEHKFIFVGGEVPPEIQYFIQSRSKIKMFLSTFGKDLDLVYMNVTNALNYSETLLKDGEKIILVIFDVVGLLNDLDMYFCSLQHTGVIERKVESIQLIKRLVGGGRFISDNNYLSTVSLILEKHKENSFVKDYLVNLMNENFIEE